MTCGSQGSRRLSSLKVILSGYERSVPAFPTKHHHHHHLDLLDAVPTTRVVTTTTSTSPSMRLPAVNDGSPPQRLKKLLVKVNIERSLGPLHVVMPSDNTVSDLIRAVIQVYVKEKRRPLLETTDPTFYQLHYSSFTLESLKAEEKLINLDSRNFFLHLKPCSSCGSQEAKSTASKSLFPLSKFMEFML